MVKLPLMFILHFVQVAMRIPLCPWRCHSPATGFCSPMTGLNHHLQFSILQRTQIMISLWDSLQRSLKQKTTKKSMQSLWISTINSSLVLCLNCGICFINWPNIQYQYTNLSGPYQLVFFCCGGIAGGHARRSRRPPVLGSHNKKRITEGSWCFNVNRI